MTSIAFLFPGQGAQTVGMARELCDEVPAARERFDEAREILGYDLLDLCLNGPADQLDSTAVSQPAIFVASLAALERLKRDQPALVAECTVTAGLSLGEYTALVFAGAMSFADGLRLVAERGAAMQDASEANPSGMVSVLGMELPQIDALVAEAAQGEVLAVANLLCPGNIVVSGATKACERLAELATAAGAMRVVPLAVAGAFHTSLMQSAVARLSAALANVNLQRPRIPVISNVDAKAHFEPAEIRSMLEQQVVRPVLWEATIRSLVGSYGVVGCYEIGPGRVLKGLMKRIERNLACENVTA